MDPSFLILNYFQTPGKHKTSNHLPHLIDSIDWLSASVAFIGFAGAIYLFKRWARPRPMVARDALNYMNINMVSSEASCNAVVAELRRKCQEYKALGFDCEWVSGPGFRNPVAMLQLSSIDGYCGLFRLNQMNTVPKSLKDLLEDRTICKVGIVPSDDAKHLMEDYSVHLWSTVDIRHLAGFLGYNPGGLANLSKNLFNIILDKDWKVSCSNWEEATLTERQIQYAAADAHIAVKIFVKLVNEIAFNNSSYFPWLWWGNEAIVQEKLLIWTKYADVPFKAQNNRVHKLRSAAQVHKKLPLKKKYSNLTRKSPLYHNCYLEAPDGEVLCTCDYKKAQWYVDKGLANEVRSEPLTVRLKFEPSGRSVGNVGRYYQSAKENRCVVCGSYNSYIRKNVVPREYRKHFPDIMKEHSSHDVVLLCVQCHQISNVRDQAVRRRLAVDCDAPLSTQGDNAKYFEDVDSRKIRSAARALLFQSRKKNILPEERRDELEGLLMRYYPQESGVTRKLLEEAANVPVVIENSEYESHGVKVVEHFLHHDGLLRLEELWRQHFLDAMRPEFMPPLWSITHNEERLIVKLNEGRLQKEDPKLIGVGLS